MSFARLLVAPFVVLFVAGCTVSAPHHFRIAGDYDFLDSGLQVIPATGQMVALPNPD